MKKVSLHDIAKELGVSSSLVSLVINGKAKENRISEKRIEEVKSLADKLGYKPNRIAQSLQSGQTHIIALLVADISNAFFAKMGRYIEDEAGKFGYKVIFSSYDENPDKLTELVDVLIGYQVDGFIISPSMGNNDYVKILRKKDIPFVFIDRKVNSYKTDYVIVDNEMGSYSAVKYLIESGHKKVGLLSVTQNLTNISNRVEGYKRALKEAGIRKSSKLVSEIDYYNFEESFNNSIESLLDNRVGMTALFCCTYRITISVMDYLNEHGVKIPEDLALLTFDDSIEFRFLNPSISAIEQPLMQMSTNSVEILINKMKSETNCNEVTQIRLPTKLIIRNST